MTSQLKHIRLENTEGVARITLARPKHNVLNIDLMNEFNGELSKLLTDDQLKCLVLLAEGPSWCAGVEVADHKPALVEEMITTFNRIFKLIEQLQVPTIAAVHGACLGGGMELAIACDMVLAAEGAIFGQPEIKLGFLPPYAAIRLPRLVGVARAIEICTTGRRYTAAEGLQMGFVSHLYPADEFSGQVEKMIQEIAQCSPLIIRLNKQAVKRHLKLVFEAALEEVGEMFLKELMRTEDTLEGIASFEEKRRPVWKNR
jgi:cyclohexa-1,5-dienecarbonyl-CoA hydratase